MPVPKWNVLPLGPVAAQDIIERPPNILGVIAHQAAGAQCERPTAGPLPRQRGHGAGQQFFGLVPTHHCRGGE